MLVQIRRPPAKEIDLKTIYDAVVVGSGAAGGMAARVLTAHGLKVLLLEAGKQLDIDKELKSMEWPYDHPRRGDMPSPSHALSLNEYNVRQPPPGARAAGCAAYIDARLAEAFLPAEAEVQERWRAGLALVDAASGAMHGVPFTKASADQRVAVLTRMSANEKDPKTSEERFFVELKGWTVRAYYTSKIGIHEELEYKGNTLLEEFAGESPQR